MSHAPNPENDQGFSHHLKQVEAFAVAPRVRIRDLEMHLADRGFASAIIILCLPFLQPVPVPGLSVAFGLVIAALGGRLLLSRSAKLPEFLARREVDSAKLRLVLHGAQRLFEKLDPLFRRRLSGLVDVPCGHLIAFSVILGGLAMALPLPPVVLFSNGLPAFGVLLVCLGWIERDGLFVLVGHVVTVATWIYFAFWWEVVRLLALELWEKWS